MIIKNPFSVSLEQPEVQAQPVSSMKRTRGRPRQVYDDAISGVDHDGLRIASESHSESTMADYRNGGEGCIKWIEDHVCFKIVMPGESEYTWVPASELPDIPHPVTKRSIKRMWEEQKHEIRRALEMVNGRFKYRLIVLCWPRGEGKSFIACLIQMWKFFCFPAQQIMLGANSKDQVKFIHYEIIRDLILNSPRLLHIVGEKNIQEKEIRLTDGHGHSVSIIRSISSFSGIVSNITGYTFSEMFDMKNPKFFVQLSGSTRSIPNALGVIDSTVSDLGHILYKLYKVYKDKQDPLLYFSYRSSDDGHPSDYWNPETTEEQLNSYRTQFPDVEFARYFLNKWAAGAARLFTPAMIEATRYVGVDGIRADGRVLLPVVNDMVQFRESHYREVEKDESTYNMQYLDRAMAVQSRLMPVSNLYQLRDGIGAPTMATIDQLEALGDFYDTDWAVLVGADRADPMKSSRAGGARTILTAVAKGLPGSRSGYSASPDAVPRYMYVVVYVSHIKSSSLVDIKYELKNIQIEFDGIDSLCAERWGMFDAVDWCEGQSIPLELIHNGYDVQRAAFSMMYGAYAGGLFKCAELGVPGSRGSDILAEEAEMFDHDEVKRWYGSPEKGTKYGVQDDAMYATAYAIFGGRGIDVTAFRSRRVMSDWGVMVSSTGLAGRY